MSGPGDAAWEQLALDVKPPLQSYQGVQQDV